MHIIPQRLRHLRNERQMSRGDLAAKSTVSEKQIQRLESPRLASRNVRTHTLNSLAKALGVEPEQLTGEPAAPDEPRPIRGGAALGPGGGLAYELIEQRFNVTVGELLNLAPLFFALLAEGSLAWRRAELTKVRGAISQLGEFGGPSRHRFAAHARHAVEETYAEEQAIAQGDLFVDPLGPDYEEEAFDEWYTSPFADYLCKLADDLGKPELIDLDPLFHGRVSARPGMPAYRIYSEDLSKVAPLESDAMYALHSGDAGLADIPDELKASDAADARQRWLEDKLSPASKEWLDGRQRMVSQLKLLVDDASEGGSDSAQAHGGDQ